MPYDSGKGYPNWITNGRGRREVVATLDATQPEPMLCVDIYSWDGWDFVARTWLTKSEWDAWIAETGATLERRPAARPEGSE